jgi:ribonuclease HI
MYTGEREWTKRTKTHTACEYTGKKSTILDAEFTVIILALEGLIEKKPKRAWIFTDNQEALRNAGCTKPKGPLAYLNARYKNALTTAVETTEIFGTYIPAHKGLRGNEEADQEAKKANPKPANYEEKPMTHTFLKKIGTERRTKEWEQWYQEKVHHYSTRRPTKRMKHMRDLSRQEESLLMRLRTNKGWSTLVAGTPEHCKNCNKQDDAIHRTRECPRWSKGRPPPTMDVRNDKHLPKYVEWFRTNNLLDFKSIRTNVEGVNLPAAHRYPRQGINKNKRKTCEVCKKEMWGSAYRKHVEKCQKPKEETCAGCGKNFKRIRMHERGGRCTGSRS